MTASGNDVARDALERHHDVGGLEPGEHPVLELEHLDARDPQTTRHASFNSAARTVARVAVGSVPSVGSKDPASPRGRAHQRHLDTGVHAAGDGPAARQRLVVRVGQDHEQPLAGHPAGERLLTVTTTGDALVDPDVLVDHAIDAEAFDGALANGGPIEREHARATRGQRFFVREDAGRSRRRRRPP